MNSKGKTSKGLDINYCISLIKAMPSDQAIQLMKSEITGHPETIEIKGDLIVIFAPKTK